MASTITTIYASIIGVICSGVAVFTLTKPGSHAFSRGKAPGAAVVVEPTHVAPPPPAPAITSTPVPVASWDSLAGEVSIAPLPANATSVPDDDLLKLSALVNLAGAADQPIDEERWAKAVPIAEQLVQGPCDCEQRNWLNHFIEMGHEALQGPSDNYYRLARLMVKLARNDNQVTDDVQRTAR